jgi:hypothetical protein
MNDKLQEQLAGYVSFQTKLAKFVVISSVIVTFISIAPFLFIIARAVLHG